MQYKVPSFYKELGNINNTKAIFVGNISIFSSKHRIFCYKKHKKVTDFQKIIVNLHHMNRIGIFVGTFDPFTIGHDSIVRRVLPLFDRLIIGVVGDNVNKPGMRPMEERMQAIAELYKGQPTIEVKPYYGLAMDFARNEGAQFIVKGVRSVADFEYERQQADFNRQIGGVETILLYTEPELASISSSAVRELSHFGVDVSSFLPSKTK